MASSLVRLGLSSLRTIAPTSVHSARLLPSTSSAISYITPSSRPFHSQSIQFKRARAEDVEDEPSNGGRGGKGKKGGNSSSKSASTSAEEESVDWPTLLDTSEQKMTGSLEHFTKELAALENRASGRVNASLFDAVRVPSLDGSVRYRLGEVGTVGVKEGSTIVITLFDEKVRSQS